MLLKNLVPGSIHKYKSNNPDCDLVVYEGIIISGIDTKLRFRVLNSKMTATVNNIVTVMPYDTNYIDVLATYSELKKFLVLK